MGQILDLKKLELWSSRNLYTYVPVVASAPKPVVLARARIIVGLCLRLRRFCRLFIQCDLTTDTRRASVRKDS